MKRGLLFLLFTFAILVRLYNIPYFASYGTETAQHYLEIIKLLQGDFFLSGPFTSHVWLRLGAIPYYLFFPIFYLTHFHPLSLFYFWVFVDITTLFLNYYVVKQVLNEKTAMASTLILSFSPFALTLNRVSGFYNFVIPLSYFLLLFLYRTLHKKSASFWPIFLIVGIIINLHASSFIFIPFFIGLGIYLKQFSKPSIVASIFAFIIPNIPFLIKDFSGGLNMSKNLLIWIPYKILNFFSGKTLGVNRVQVQDETLANIINFFKMTILPLQFSFVFGIIIIISLLLFFFLKKNPLFIRILYFWLFFGIITLLIHKNPPIHYFVPVFILPIILISYFLTKLQKIRKIRLVVLGIITFIILSDLLFVFSPRYLFLDRKKISSDIPYSTQKKIAQFIIQDTRGKNYSLSRIGAFDNYAGGSKENYEYLLWWLGNRPVRESNLKYVIVEDKNRMLKTSSTEAVTEVDGIVVLKEP